jgi:hypothetical protein
MKKCLNELNQKIIESESIQTEIYDTQLEAMSTIDSSVEV